MNIRLLALALSIVSVIGTQSYTSAMKREESKKEAANKVGKEVDFNTQVSDAVAGKLGSQTNLENPITKNNVTITITNGSETGVSGWFWDGYNWVNHNKTKTVTLLSAGAVITVGILACIVKQSFKNIFNP